MVFNEDNYPNMVRLFEELGVGSEKTDMSFRYAKHINFGNSSIQVSGLSLRCLRCCGC